MKTKAFILTFLLMIVTLSSCNHAQKQPTGCPIDKNGVNILNNTTWEAHDGSVPFLLTFNGKSGEYKIGDSSYSVTIPFKSFTYDGNTLFLQSTNGDDDQSFYVIAATPTTMTLKVKNNNAAEEITYHYKTY